MDRLFRTDLADEQRAIYVRDAGNTGEIDGVKASEETADGFRVSTVEILDARGEKALCKPAGKYVTLDIDALVKRREDAFLTAVLKLSSLLRGLLGEAGGATLVAGLGNAEITPDAVGPLALSSVLATRHLKAQLPDDFAGFSSVAAVKPGVLGATGIESASVVSSLCKEVSPARVIVIDALACSELPRLCRTVQLSSAGIVPGSGVCNDRAELSKASLGVPVVAVGVPTVVDASLFSDDANAAGMFVTPRDIDTRVRDAAKLIGYAVNLALHDGLTIEDVDMLLS